MADINIPAEYFFGGITLVGSGAAWLIKRLLNAQLSSTRVKELAYKMPRMRSEIERRAGIPSIMPPAERPRKKMKTLAAINVTMQEELKMERLLREYVDGPGSVPASSQFLGFEEDRDPEVRETERPPKRR